ncbi:cell wall / vacuolar inhibitor of fructosidase 1-like [Cicer arietinum]|uniref:Cell wall / vacuolar inhibitor of fructosidase 1-like n=1 Tax=Cicer arietinum TaxID=3827 RepID=A0A1S2YPZ6_CICAR|nr:cell wall / vacuolar inhibitor of fructosidase 1-like [Cicer arietinum]
MSMIKPFILILCTIVVVTQGKTVTTNYANLIQQTCRKTPNYGLCIQYLNGSPGSSTADVNGLAQIMVNVIKTKASIALNKIHQIIGRSAQKVALNSCVDKYNAVLVADIPQAIQALQRGNPKFAEDGANDAAVEANSCENGFSGKSPLTAENRATQDAAAITAAIVRLLL